MDKIRRSFRRPPRNIPEQGRSDALKYIPPDTLGTLPEDVLLSLPSERFDVMTAENLARLPRNVIVRSLSQANLERLPTSVLVTLPSRTLEGLSPTTLQYLPPETLMSLSPHTLSMLPPNCLSQLPTETLRKLPRETLLMLPHSITRQIFTNDESTAPGQHPFHPPDRYGIYEAPIFNHVSQQPIDVYAANQPQPSLTGEQSIYMPRRQEQFLNRSPSVGRLAHAVSQSGLRPEPLAAQAAAQAIAAPPLPPTRSPNRTSLPADTVPLTSGKSEPRNERRVSDPQPRRSKSSAVLGWQVPQRGGNKDNRELPTTKEVEEPDGVPDGQAASTNHTASFLQPLRRPLLDTQNVPGDGVFGHGRSVSSTAAESISAERNQWKAEKQDFRNRLKQTSASLDEARAALENERRHLAKVGEELAWEKERKKTLDQVVAQTRQELDATRREAHEKTASERRFQTMVAALEEKLKEQEHTHSKNTKALMDETKRARADDHAKHQQEMGAKAAEHDEALAKLLAEHEAQARALTEEISRQRSVTEREKQSADTMSAELRKELGKANKKWGAKVEGLNRHLDDMKAKHAEEIQRLQQAHRDEMDKARNESDLGLRSHEEQHTNEMAKLRTDIARLHQALAASQQALNASKQAVTTQKADLTAEMERQRGFFEKQMSRLAYDQDNARERETAEQQAKLDALAANHRAELGQQQTKHREKLAQMKAELTQYKGLMIRERENHYRALMTQRMDSAEAAYQPAEADLVKKFTDLKLAVEMVTAPFNLGRLCKVRVPKGSRLDPTRFLEREAQIQGATRFLLQSAVWATVVDGFFSAPCGFGAFGAGNGKRMLVELYQAWQRLFAAQGSDDGDTVTEDPGFGRFKQDREANRWRSATFNSLLTAMVLKKGKKASAEGDDPDQGLLTPYAVNKEKVREDILTMLREVTNGQLLEEIEDEVDKITRLGGELALEIGVHRSFIELSLPEQGSLVQIGPHFADCHDGDAARGAEEEVDLVVCPRFSMTGDGRGDFKKEKSMHPGWIYPRRSRSLEAARG